MCWLYSKSLFNTRDLVVNLVIVMMNPLQSLDRYRKRFHFSFLLSYMKFTKFTTIVLNIRSICQEFFWRLVMLKNLIYLVVGYWGIYISDTVLPVMESFELSVFLSNVVFSPFTLVIAGTCFLIGSLAFAKSIKEIIEMIVFFIRYKGQLSIVKLLPIIGIISSFYFLFLSATVIPFLSLLFSLFYGMISLDLDKGKSIYFKEQGGSSR
jgi:hypothetical protein